MNVASMTAIAISQGLRPPGAEALGAGGGVIGVSVARPRNELLKMRPHGRGVHEENADQVSLP
jgi:hypothetical protein